MSFTAQEGWSALPGKRSKYVFTSEYYDLPEAKDEQLDQAWWDSVIATRTSVSKALENARNEGVVKSGLEASVTLYADEALAATLNQLGNELRFVLITSSVAVKPVSEKSNTAVQSEMGENLWIDIAASVDEKCERCWHRLPDVGQHAEHPTICGRCVENVDGTGEQRRYA